MPDITIDATSSFETPGTLEWTHDQGDLTNGYIVVMTGCNNNGESVSAVTYDGDAMEELASQIDVLNPGEPYVQAWGLAVGGKASGTYTISCTKTGNTCSGGACASINNAAQSGSLRASGGTTDGGTTTSKELTTVPGDFAMDLCMKRADDNDTFDQGADEVEICDLDANSAAYGDAEFSSSYELVTSTATTMSATWDTTRVWAYLMVVIRAVPLAGGQILIIG